MGFVIEDIGNLKVVKYQFPSDHGNLRELLPCWRMKLNNTILDDCISASVTDNMNNAMTSCDLTFEGIQNYASMPLSCDKTILIEQGYNDQYSEVFTGIIDDRNVSETSITEDFSIFSRNKLAKIAHPWFNTLLTNYWSTPVRISTIMAYCVGLSGLRLVYSAFDWELPRYDTSGHYPIDIMSELASKIYAQIQVIGDVVYISPKIPLDLNSPVITFRDNDDVIFLSEKNATDQYFNRVTVVSGTQRFYNNQQQNKEYTKVVDYTPMGISSYINTPEIPTLNPDDPNTYQDTFNNWADQNATTMGAAIISPDFFTSRSSELPVSVRYPPSNKYTNEEKVYFEDTFMNTGTPVKGTTCKAYGGSHKESGGTHTYSEAEYVANSYGINQGKVKIPYTVTENPEYQPWVMDSVNANIRTTFAIRDYWYDATEQIADPITKDDLAWNTYHSFPIEGLIDHIYPNFPEGQSQRWFYMREKKSHTFVVLVWGTTETIDAYCSPDRFEDVTYEQIGSDPFSPYLYPNIPPWPTPPGERAAPVFTSDAYTKTTGKDGIAYFPRCAITSIPYTREKTIPGFEFKDLADITFESVIKETIDNVYKYARAGTESGDPSRYKYIINATEYNWLITATTTQEPYGAPIPIPLDWNGTLTVDKLSEIQSFGRVVQPLTSIEDPIITDRAIAYYIANGFLNWSVAQKREIVVRVPSVPFRLRGKVVRIIDTRLDLDLNLYVISQKKTLTTTGTWDELTTLRFVL